MLLLLMLTVDFLPTCDCYCSVTAVVYRLGAVGVPGVAGPKARCAPAVTADGRGVGFLWGLL